MVVIENTIFIEFEDLFPQYLKALDKRSLNMIRNSHEPITFDFVDSLKRNCQVEAQFFRNKYIIFIDFSDKRKAIFETQVSYLESNLSAPESFDLIGREWSKMRKLVSFVFKFSNDPYITHKIKIHRKRYCVEIFEYEKKYT